MLKFLYHNDFGGSVLWKKWIIIQCIIIIDFHSMYSNIEISKRLNINIQHPIHLLFVNIMDFSFQFFSPVLWFVFLWSLYILNDNYDVECSRKQRADYWYFSIIKSRHKSFFLFSNLLLNFVGNSTVEWFIYVLAFMAWH